MPSREQRKAPEHEVALVAETQRRARTAVLHLQDVHQLTQGISQATSSGERPVVPRAIGRGLPAAIHLAGSRDEYDFVKYGSSQLGQDFRQQAGWRDFAWMPTGVSPVRYVLQWGLFDVPNIMAVHCTQVDDADIEVLGPGPYKLKLCSVYEEDLQRALHYIRYRVEVKMKLQAPLIITARHPNEGGVGKLSLRERFDLLARFLAYADYLDVELRSVLALQELLAIAQKKNVRRIISFHNFKSTPAARILTAKAQAAELHHADIFKVATRTDTPMELGRLFDFMTNGRVQVPLAVMGLGKLGAISRVLLARTGSALIYASVGSTTDIEGQLSLQQVRELGIAT